MSNFITDTAPLSLEAAIQGPETLRLVPFERFLFQSDSAATPVVFRVVMRFDGPYRADLLSQAFRLAVARQPLLTSRIVATPEGHHWQSHDELPELQWRTADSPGFDPVKLPIEWIDLTKSAGINARIWPIDGGLTILLDVNHVCCDGQGARQFISEWFGLYQQLVAGGDLRITPTERTPLTDRGNYRLPTPPISTWEGLRNLYLTVRGKTIYLPRRAAHGEFDGTSDHVCELPLSAEETAALRKRLKRNGYTVNDAGLAAAFVAFTKSFPDVLHRRKKITILHPVDLRWPSDLKTPACNRVGVSFLRRTPGEIKNPAEALKSVRDQMQYVKQRYVGAEFLRGLAMTAEKPGVTDWLQRMGCFVPTMQFTCLGDTTRAMHYRFPMTEGIIDFHGLKLNRISGIMQMGPFLPLSLAACETNQRLSLTLRASASYLTAEEANRFLETFVGELVAIAPE
ncbi:hypothetical protein [Planctomicrobium piriforme]|uniref:Condensation domain-containing protein n=1 Tax=Planctomicrobium piriforme TaxID=1576369 RepID=A0A1I3DC30_9PLAN|nr:hypothetical protein [Planctomicrobium piriforme]SFH84129.1 hypothetical protein SAMN05421753_103170 [Planctomicrobium piriforme]